MNLKDVLADINHKFGLNTIGTVRDMKNISVGRISSGIPFLDWALGGGWPEGRIAEIYGIESSGKTLTVLLTIASAQKEGKSVALIDAENSFDPEFAKQLGVDVDKLVVSQSSVGETTIDIVLDLLKASPDIVILDSVAAMVPQAELENPTEKDTMALIARVMGKALRKFTAVNKKTLLIMVNQLRSTLAMYGAPTITPGGRALKHFASIRVEIANGGFLEEKERKLGQIVKFKVVKNKSAPPWRQGYYKFWYATTSRKPVVDISDSLVSLGIQNGVIGRSGAFYEVLGQKYHGRESLETELKQKPELFDKLREEVLKNGK